MSAENCTFPDCHFGLKIRQSCPDTRRKSRIFAGALLIRVPAANSLYFSGTLRIHRLIPS